MASTVVSTFTWFLVGVVLGGLAVFAFIELTDGGDDQGGSDNSTGTRVTDSLQYLVVISRHGNRGTFEDYPSDPYPLNDTKYYPYGTNALTPKGRVQAYKLGKKVRALYNGFLSSTFHSEDIYACSDLYERVVMSGDLFLAGLYPPQGWQVWDSDVDWQPIALYTNSTDHTNVINSCPRYKEEKNITYSAYLKEYAATITSLTDYVYNKTNQNITADDLSYMFEKMLSEVTEGYVLPKWAQNIYPNLTQLYGPSFIASCAGSDENVRLWVGNMFEEILDTMNEKVAETSSRKIAYYSGHDVTLLNLQVALGVPRSSVMNIIKPSSALVVELHKNSTTSEYFVQVVYIDGSALSSEPVTLSLGSCGQPCSYTSFLNTSKTFTGVNFTEECQTLSSTPAEA